VVVSLKPAESNICGNPSGPAVEVWSENDSCVGVTDGSVTLDQEFNDRREGRFGAVLDEIRRENHAVDTGTVTAAGGSTTCTETSREAVTVVALAPWRSELAGSRSYHELEGMFVAQWRANHLGQPGGCSPFIKLLVADAGPDLADREASDRVWGKVVDAVAKVPGLVAVVGLALSRRETIAAARTLNARGIPVVADLVTADGFDTTNFKNVNNRCDRLADPATDLNLFHRITFSNQKYYDRLGDVLRGTNSLTPWNPAVQVTQSGYQDDPFVCTNVQHVNDLIAIESSTRGEPITFGLSVNGKDSTAQLELRLTQVCSASVPARTIFYNARSLDLASFLNALARSCGDRKVTVVAPSDATRLLTPELQPAREQQRLEALRTLSRGTVRLLFVASTTPTVLAGQPGFEEFKVAFAAAFENSPHRALFPLSDTELADTWMLNAHDAMFTVAAAVHALDVSGQAHTAESVANNLGGLTVAKGAHGPIGFDQDGTRTGQPTTMLLCSDGSTTWTRVATPASVPDC
jgi:hypothetical protein